ncbi:hypothetical protein BpHYR1_051477 [Brachionus plicatilis]|uniref:Uncharacterized protein n=1 Tax=Brachionus plicatilis TaxID=10195 RepID=A0A3M7S2F0_BRAPC|nr:hypothetical protein BpHYR1_051477 [Brachionus plicatilis]
MLVSVLNYSTNSKPLIKCFKILISHVFEISFIVKIKKKDQLITASFSFFVKVEYLENKL